MINFVFEMYILFGRRVLLCLINVIDIYIILDCNFIRLLDHIIC